MYAFLRRFTTYKHQSDINCLISAPTGSGKTLLFELAFVHAFARSRDIKVVYLAPLKVRAMFPLV